MKELLDFNQLIKLSENVNNSVGDDFNKEIMTVSFTLSEEGIDKINEELFYKTRKDDNDKIKKANIVKAKINGINFEFKPAE